MEPNSPGHSVILDALSVVDGRALLVVAVGVALIVVGKILSSPRWGES